MWHFKNRRLFEIAGMIDGGMAPKEVARELGISVWTVYRASKRTPHRQEYNPSRSVYKKTLDLKDKATELLNSGMCVKAVAIACNVSVWSVYRAIKSSGILFKKIVQNEPKTKTQEETHKSIVRSYTKVYVRRGKIKKNACECCGETKVEIHHLDYNDPFSIKWLCFKHHRELHRELRKTQHSPNSFHAENKQH